MAFSRRRRNRTKKNRKRCESRSSRPAALPRRAGRRPLLEPLEPRLLLSGDMLYTALAGEEIELRIEDVAGVESVQLVNAADPGDVLASQALSEIDGASGAGVRIEGNGFDVNLSIDDGADLSVIAGGVFFDGGTGENRLTAANQANQWQIDGDGSGNVGALQFSGVENLTGGDGADTFNFEADGRVAGRIDGAGGADTVVGPDIVNTWRLTGTTAGSVNDQVFISVEEVRGGGDKDFFVLGSGIEGFGARNPESFETGTSGNVFGGSGTLL